MSAAMMAIILFVDFTEFSSFRKFCMHRSVDDTVLTVRKFTHAKVHEH